MGLDTRAQLDTLLRGIGLQLQGRCMLVTEGWAHVATAGGHSLLAVGARLAKLRAARHEDAIRGDAILLEHVNVNCRTMFYC